MKWYEGKEPCQGCGRPGTLISRRDKNSLCEDCRKAIQIGRAFPTYRDTIKLTRLVVAWYSFGRRDFDNIANEFLKAISNEDGKNTLTGVERLKNGDAGNASNVYYVPTLFAEPLVKFLDGFSEIGHKTYRLEEELEKKKQEELKAEKNKIFNDGVAYGRNLLFQLNRGEITAQDINEEVIKY